jgi:hypothetical protein
MIPAFDVNGNLPEGIHWASWQEFSERFGTSDHRRKLLFGLSNALSVLKAAGCQAVYIDGSFVTAKSVPNDFDACWDISGVDPLLLDPILLEVADKCAAQKAKYFGEFMPAQFQEGKRIEILRIYQVDKETGKSKGLVALDLRRLQM